MVDEEGKPLKNIAPVIDVSLENADFSFELLVAELKLRGASKAKELLVVTDGAQWIWKRSKELANSLGLEEEKLHCVLDFYHASERLNKVAECCKKWSKKEKQAWYQKQRKLLLKGRWPEVLKAIRDLSQGRRKAQIKEHLQYLEGMVDYMNYKEYRQQGIPCGSGATESAIRRVINLRLKGAGIFWKEEHAEKMLHLRAYLKSGRWTELMQRVLHQHSDGETPDIPSMTISYKERLAA